MATIVSPKQLMWIFNAFWIWNTYSTDDYFIWNAFDESGFGYYSLYLLGISCFGC